MEQTYAYTVASAVILLRKDQLGQERLRVGVLAWPATTTDPNRRLIHNAADNADQIGSLTHLHPIIGGPYPRFGFPRTVRVASTPHRREDVTELREEHLPHGSRYMLGNAYKNYVY